MLAYLVQYSVGSSVHDEERRAASILAKDFADAGARAERLAAQRGGIVTSITRKDAPFTKGSNNG